MPTAQSSGSTRFTAVVRADWPSWFQELPAGLTVGLAGFAAVAQLAALGGAEPLTGRAGSVLLLCLALATSVAVIRSRCAVRHRRADGHVILAALLAPVAVLLPLLVGLVLGREGRVGWFLANDNLRHAVLVAQVQHRGELSYVDGPYPQLWHSVLAAAVSVGGDHGPADLVLRVIDVDATASWILSSVWCLATALLARSVAMATGAPQRLLWSAPAAGGLALLVPVSWLDMMALGFQTSLLAGTALAVALRECLLPPSRTGLVVAVGGVVVVAHAWQPLLPVAVAAAVWCTVRLVCRSSGTIASAILVWAVGSAAAVWPVVAVVTSLEGETVGAPGFIRSSPWPVFLVALLAVSWWVWRGPGVGVRVVAVLTALPAALAVGLAVVFGASLADYYPSKLFWQTGVLGLPLAAAVLPAVASRTTSWPRPRLLAVSALGLAVGAVAVATPTLLFATGRPADTSLVLRAMTAVGAAEADAVWVGDNLDTAAVRVLMDALTPADEGTGGITDLSVTQECDALLASATPTVLTDRSEAQARARYACAPSLRVVLVTAG